MYRIGNGIMFNLFKNSLQCLLYAAKEFKLIKCFVSIYRISPKNDIVVQSDVN